jgi:lipid-A-disaccharide synthase
MQPSVKRIVVIAGEESGDKHAAELVSRLKKSNPHLEVSGIGGRHMQAAGVTLLSDLARFGVTGFTEVIRHLRVIRKAYQLITAHLKQNKPDLLILVDYPGFNLRLAQFAKKTLGIKILYYISPQIWAWKPGRIKTIQACVDHMAVILPFEKKLYEQHGVPVSFVGHPLVKRIDELLHQKISRERFNLPQNKRIIALLPGSRINEIVRHMPVLSATAIQLSQKYHDLHFVIPIADTIDPSLVQSYWLSQTASCSFVQGHAIEIAQLSDVVVVASGTASLECALLLKPMCIIYKASLTTYLLAIRLIRIKYIGLCNLLQNEMIVPELLQYDCNPKELTKMVESLLNDKDMVQHMQSRLLNLKESLSLTQADHTLDEVVEQLLNNKPTQHECI